MKYLNNSKKWLVALILCLILVMCMTIEEIIHPVDPQVNSEIEISVKLKLVPESPNRDQNSKMVFAVLAPKSWNIANNAVLTFSTSGYAKGDLVDEQMTLMAESETEPTTALPWSTAIQSEIGFMGNLGPVEWVVFESQTGFSINDNDAPLITANVKIKLTTGSQNIKLFMGYFFSGKNRGMKGNFYTENATSKVLTVSGGSNALIDFTTVKLVTTEPASFGFGDIFSINFETKTVVMETPLNGAEKVYMLGKIIFANGTDSSIVDIISDKTLMEEIGETTWQKYIYPREFFNLPNDAVLDKAHFYFTNEDKSIIVKDVKGNDFLITETCN
jgi:hypothetical protein